MPSQVTLRRSPQSSAAIAVQAGAAIVNARGVPGSLACMVWSRTDGKPLLLTSWHVLFGKGARPHDPVWLVDVQPGGRCYREIGKALCGHAGNVLFAGEPHYIDCAICSLLFETPKDFPSLEDMLPLAHLEPGEADCTVRKTGAATGTTSGSLMHSCVSLPGRGRASRGYSNQLLIRPAEGQAVFSAEGDSGALVTTSDGSPLALLWGSTSRGEGVASPLEPVLRTLNISLTPPV